MHYNIIYIYICYMRLNSFILTFHICDNSQYLFLVCVVSWRILQGYAYMLLVVFFLQSVQPPVVPWYRHSPESLATEAWNDGNWLGIIPI